MKYIAIILTTIAVTLMIVYYTALFVPINNEYDDYSLRVEIIELQNRIARLEIKVLNLTKDTCTLSISLNGLIYDYYDMPFDQADRLVDSPCLECH